MTRKKAHAHAAKKSKEWVYGAYVVHTGIDFYEVFSLHEWHEYGYSESETIAVYEDGENVSSYV